MTAPRQPALPTMSASALNDIALYDTAPHGQSLCESALDGSAPGTGPASRCAPGLHDPLNKVSTFPLEGDAL
jgi:hypothetical protein